MLDLEESHHDHAAAFENTISHPQTGSSTSQSSSTTATTNYHLDKTQSKNFKKMNKLKNNFIKKLNKRKQKFSILNNDDETTL